MTISGRAARRRLTGLAAAVMLALPAILTGAAGSAGAAGPVGVVGPVGVAGSADDAARGPRAEPVGDRGGHRGWTATWSTAVHHPVNGIEWIEPNWSGDGFADESVRQVVRASTGGPLVRIELSNLYGERALRLTGATIGKAGDGAEVLPGTIRTLTFDHRRSTTVPAGDTAVSDATLLWTRPLDKLSVTLYFEEPTGPATFHEGGLTTSYRADGDHRYDRGATAYAGETTHSWYYLSGVDVRSFGRQGTVVAFGDSITDGYGSTPNTDNRYPDELAERLVDSGRRMGVVNAGINGNKVLTDSTCFGEKGVTRFARDALGQSGVRTAIVLLGINDIGGAGFPDQGCGTSPVVTAEQIIEGHRTIIRAAHEQGVTVIGGTLTPIKGNPYYYNEANEKVRDAVNEWIRTSGEYDAVVDFDRALADPDDPDAMRPEYAAPDFLHPNDAGMTAMAAAVDLSTL